MLHCDSGRRIPIDGVGLHAADTSSRFPSLGGRIRYQELAAGRIDHALFAASSRVAYTWVYPAEKSDGRWEPGEGYPPMGTRFQLDPAYMTDERLATYPPWKRAILRAIRDYGFYLGDSTNKSLKVFPIESGTGYTSFGLADPWVTYAKRAPPSIVLRQRTSTGRSTRSTSTAASTGASCARSTPAWPPRTAEHAPDATSARAPRPRAGPASGRSLPCRRRRARS